MLNLTHSMVLGYSSSPQRIPLGLCVCVFMCMCASSELLCQQPCSMHDIHVYEAQCVTMWKN